MGEGGGRFAITHPWGRCVGMQAVAVAEAQAEDEFVHAGPNGPSRVIHVVPEESPHEADASPPRAAAGLRRLDSLAVVQPMQYLPQQLPPLRPMVG